MRVSEFHFDLPEDLIAQSPPAERGTSRMLLLDRRTGARSDRRFSDLPDLLQPGDLLVLNDTRVLPARLYARKATQAATAGSSPGGLIEVLLTETTSSGVDGEAASGHTWNALVRPAKKVRVGDRLHFDPPGDPSPAVLQAEVIGSGAFGERTLRFAPVQDFLAVVERIGHMPLPPYIRRPRHVPDLPEDRERYQTVYARRDDAPSPRTGPDSLFVTENGTISKSSIAATPAGTPEGGRSAAAPTAGLHFTPEILSTLTARGVELARLTLHVGRGTFQPVRIGTTEEIRLHAERYTLSPETAAAINRARAEKRRIVAVGTTSTRTLEHCARLAQQQGTRDLLPGSGETSLFLSPGDPFLVVSGLLTNFHLPESTLLMLVSAFAGREHVLDAYRYAVAERFRFFSYGDCMLLL